MGRGEAVAGEMGAARPVGAKGGGGGGQGRAGVLGVVVGVGGQVRGRGIECMHLTDAVVVVIPHVEGEAIGRRGDAGREVEARSGARAVGEAL